jgi:hypothetical protein
MNRLWLDLGWQMPSYPKHGQDLMEQVFCEMCQTDPLVEIRPVNGDLVALFNAGIHERKAVRLCYNPGSVVIEVHTSHSCATSNDHANMTRVHWGVHFATVGHQPDPVAKNLFRQSFYMHPSSDLLVFTESKWNLAQPINTFLQRQGLLRCHHVWERELEEAPRLITFLKTMEPAGSTSAH